MKQDQIVPEFAGATNLRTLTLSATNSYTMPVIPAACTP